LIEAPSIAAAEDVHAELVEIVLRLHHHIEQMRNRRSLVAADVGDAGLQQRFRHGEDALAVEGFTVA